MTIISKYLKPNRLSDVIRLISVLGIDNDYSFRKNDGLDKTLNGKPLSGGEWFEIAKEHPEFFKLNTDTNTIILLLRFLKRNLVNEEYEYPRLSVEETQKLIDQAITLNDKQMARISILIPILISIVALLVNLIPNNDIKQVEKKIDNLILILYKDCKLLS